MKRIVSIIIILAVIAGVILIGYYLRSRLFIPNAPGQSPGISGQLPVGGAGGPQGPSISLTPVPLGQPEEQGKSDNQHFGLVAVNQALDYFVDKNNNIVLIQPNGQVVQVTSGKTTVLSSSAIQGLSQAIFSFDGNYIFVRFGSRNAPQMSLFNVQQKVWEPLANTLEYPVWSPTSDELGFFFRSSNGIVLIMTLDVTKKPSKPKEIGRIRAQDIRLLWPTSQYVLIYDIGSAYAQSSLLKLNIKDKTFTAILQDVVGFDIVWDSKSNQGLVLLGNESSNGGHLELVNDQGVVISKPNFLTIPSQKCVFDTTVSTTTSPIASSSRFSGATTTVKTITTPVLICALPRDVGVLGSAPLPDNYLRKSFFTNDDLILLDLTTGNSNVLLSDPGYALDEYKLKVFNQRVFFVDRYTNLLYTLSLESLLENKALLGE